MKYLWCDISLDKLEENINNIKRISDKKIIAVVKGNAYGLGIEGITEYLKDKVDYFAVSDMTEAERIVGDKEILLLSPLVDLEDMLNPRENIIYTIDNEEILKHINPDFTNKVHIYVDTGMNRMGIKPDRLGEVVDYIKSNFPSMILDGVYTHLHNTKNNKSTINQINTFKKAVEPFIDEIPNIHCLNSSGFLQEEYRKETDFTTAIRVGNLIYGYEGGDKGFKKIFSYKAKVVNKFNVKKGSKVGYGGKYKAKEDITVGVLGIGNIEHLGFSKEVRHNVFYDILKVIYHHVVKQNSIFCNGRAVEIIGKPNMNITMINLKGFEEQDIFTIDITPILADSSILKKYTNNDVELKCESSECNE
ncbi:alanine racemase [Clostridium sp. MSJ-4]|uniref:Alanine racemase n=1 Tax=Clostridium simiarum TaxID=2841506 RepID=A0ABS6EWN2_9CLOT|nr:alanine racemase [Clostridium simiarum]MBU5590530.1 alanine racemase [Clostridium simiarum]